MVTDEVESMKRRQARVVGRVWARGQTQPVWTASARATAKESEFTEIKAGRGQFYFQATANLAERLP